jgi:hypothetical protein
MTICESDKEILLAIYSFYEGALQTGILFRINQAFLGSTLYLYGKSDPMVNS